LESWALAAVALTIEREPRVEERRRHSRVKVRLPGQFMRENRREFPCVTLDMSPGGVAFSADERVDIAERIVAYLDHVGRVEGRVVREFQGGFAIAMKLPQLKRDRLADQLTWLANRHELGMPEDRRHERIRPRKPRTTLILPTGREVIATVIDISQSGAALALASPVAPPVGTPVTVGTTKARVVRLFTDGLAVEFARMIPRNEFDEDVTL
jgi:PilZ domain